jgi:hypothetical protein
MKNYIYNDFVFDLFAVLPLNLIFGHLEMGYPRVIGYSIMRVLRIVGILKIFSLFEKFEIYMKNHYVLMYITKALLILFLLWHWTGCIYFFLNEKIEIEIYKESWY